MKFWLENPKTLFSSIQVVPLSSISFEEQLNSVTRLLIIVFIIMLLFNFRYSMHFLLISLGIIIIVYINKKMERRKESYVRSAPVIERYENVNGAPRQKAGGARITYEPTVMKKFAENLTVYKNGQKYGRTVFDTPESRVFCNDTMSIDPPSEFTVGVNQRLTGNMANPKTLIPPIVVPPTHDLEYWRDNNLIVHSHINSKGIQEDMYLSGYAESSCCGYLGEGAELVPSDEPDIHSFSSESYNPRGGIVSPIPVQERVYVPTTSVQEKYTPGYPPSGRGIVSPIPAQERAYVPTKEKYTPGYPPSGRGIVSPIPAQERAYVPVVEKYGDLTTIEDPTEVYVQKNQPGWVNTECGYNPEQVYTAGLPSNLPAGNCSQDPKMKRYNENLFTQIVTPGVYTRSQVNEPINSNIGISFQQQFEPVTCRRDDKGLHYLQHDPRIIEPATGISTEKIYDKATPDNTYDPRLTGYGTSYRSYLEPVTGQTRFYYNDIDSVRMPDYITRSKIDFLPFADSYGSMPPGGEFGNVHNPNIRTLAQDAWLRDSLEFRNDITERAMRKINADAWQQRQSPLGPNQVVHRGGH